MFQKFKNRRLALASSLAALGAIAFVPNAEAQIQPTSEEVPFFGQVAGDCSFSNTFAGTLIQEAPENNWIESTGGIPGFPPENAPSGQTTVNCTNGGILTVSEPVQISAPANFTPATEQSIVFDEFFGQVTSAGGPFDSGAWNVPTDPLFIEPNIDTALLVGMVAGDRNFGQGVPAGYYEYSVTLTATPN